MEMDHFISSNQINAWSRMLSLTGWLGIDCKSIEDLLVTVPDSPLAQVTAVPFGLKWATSMIRNEYSARLDSEICSSVLGLLFEELWCRPDASHRVHLDILISFYAVNGGDRGSDSPSSIFYISISCF